MADTHFAPAERSSAAELQQDIESASHNPIIDTVMKLSSGLLAVLNENRQIISVNEEMLKAAGLKDCEDALGLRPGEALRCVHASDEPGGCGTSKFCRTCGAAISIVTAQAEDQTVERICAAKLRSESQEAEYVFQVRAVPAYFDGKKVILLYLNEISSRYNLDYLERTFLHDINNILTSLVGFTDLMSSGIVDDEIIETTKKLTLRMRDQVEIHRVLASGGIKRLSDIFAKFKVASIIEEAWISVSGHYAVCGKKFRAPDSIPDREIYTNISMAVRVISNMLVNAFEATPEGGTVELLVEEKPHSVVFKVRNAGVIPEDVQLRIFQRYFSTKSGRERGLGTFSMKLFGEKFLKGKVDFSSSEADGTEFRFEVGELA